MNRRVMSLAVVAAAAAGFASCGDKHTVSGSIDGLGNDTLLVATISTSAGNNEVHLPDTVIAKDGKFTIDTLLEVPSYIIIEPVGLRMIDDYGNQMQSATRRLLFMLKPGESVKVKGAFKDGYLEYKSSGSAFNKDISIARDTYKASDLTIDSLNMLFQDISKLSPAEQQKKQQELMYYRMEAMFKSREAKLEYAKANLDKELGAYYLMQQPTETFGEYYPQLSESVRNGAFAERLTAMNDRYENYIAMKNSSAHIKEGNIAPDFKLKDVDGNDVSLRDIKDKYIVIDFWGSWCGWCVKGFPEMKEYYAKYKDKVEFVGIACNDKPENWEKAITEHGLSWVQLKDTDTNDVSKSYGVQGFPTKMILDKDYKFVYIGTGESQAFYDKLDELLK